MKQYFRSKTYRAGGGGTSGALFELIGSELTLVGVFERERDSDVCKDLCQFVDYGSYEQLPFLEGNF